MPVFSNISTVELILYVAIAVVVVFALVMLIVSAVFAKKHKDKEVVDMPAPAAAPVASAPVAAAPAQAQPRTVVRRVARPTYVDNTNEAPQPEVYSDATKFVLSEENPIAGNTRPVGERQGDWSNYEGEYKGYYYDPLEGCYFEGNAPVYVQKMYLPEPPPPIVKRVMPPSAPITSKPKAVRPELQKRAGFDPASIYGQYVIGNEGDEYYFTLYSNKGEMLYASENYQTKQFCLDAVKRFKKHVLAGSFSVEGEAGDYHYKLVRNINTYIGPQKSVRVDAEDSIKELKYFAQTDVVRA